MDHSPMLKSQLMAISGVTKVYYNPSVNTKMEYPCIRADLARRDAVYANNEKYIRDESYTVTFITRDSKTAPAVLDQLDGFRYSSFDRSYVTDGLHHYVYRITY